MARKKTGYLSQDWGKTAKKKSSGAYLSEDWGTTSQSQTEKEEEQRRQREQAKLQKTQKNAWANKESLREQTGGVNVGPVTPIGRDASMADFYRRQMDYAANHGNKELYDEGFAKYKAAVGRVDAAAMRQETATRAGDYLKDTVNRVTSPYRRLTGTSRLELAEEDLKRKSDRLNRDSAAYQQMAGAAAQTGSQKSYDIASNGLKRSTGRYSEAYDNYAAESNDERDRYLNALRGGDRGGYFSQTLSQDQVEGQLRMLRKQREELERQVIEAENAWGSGNYTSDQAQGVEALYRGRSQRLKELDQEIAVYERADALQRQDRMKAILDRYAPGGYLRNDLKAQRDRGKAQYEADQQKANAQAQTTLRDKTLQDYQSGRSVGGMNRNEYRQAQKEAGYDTTLEDAQHLRFYDQDVFYALYAEDPEKAKEWLQEVSRYRTDTNTAALEEAAGKNTLTRAGAFVGGTAMNWASGVANLVDPFGATAREMNRMGGALISGGAKGLTEKGLFNTGILSGTIDENTPIVGHILGGKGLGDLYSLGSSILESSATAAVAGGAGNLADAVSALGVIIMGSSASVSDYDDSLRKGLTESQAMQHALAAGINEAMFEWLSMDKLVNPDYSASALKQWFVQSGVEASEEFCTTIANSLADGYLARRDGYDTQIEYRMRELMALGESFDAAREKAEKEWTTDLINDAIGGFISGGANVMAMDLVRGGTERLSKFVGDLRNDYDRTQRLEQAGAEVSGAEAEALRQFARENGQELQAPAQRETGRKKKGQQNAQLENWLDLMDDADTMSRSNEAADKAYEESQGLDNQELARRYEEAKNRANETRQNGQAAEAEVIEGEAFGYARALREAGADAMVQEVDARVGTGSTDSSTSADASAQNDGKVSRKEARAQRRSYRELGVVKEQMTRSVEQMIADRGVGSLQEVYDETVQQYGDGAKGVAAEAVGRAAAQNLSEATNVADLNRRADAMTQGASQEVKAAVERAKGPMELRLTVQDRARKRSQPLDLKVSVKGKEGSGSEIQSFSQDGKSVVLKNGETVSADQIEGDADTMDVVQTISRLGMGAAANQMFQRYQMEVASGNATRGYQWLMDYSMAYDRGKLGKLSLKEAQAKSKLDAAVVKEAYDLGQQAKGARTQKGSETVQKALHRAKTEGATGRRGTVDRSAIAGLTLSEDQETQLSLVEKIASAFGIDVGVFASGTKQVEIGGETKEMYQGENGRYQDWKIWIDINAGRNFVDDVGSGILATMGHELTHWIQEYAPEEYEALQDFVVQRIVEARGERYLDRLIQDKINRARDDLSREEALDEVVADACQEILSDSKAVQKLANENPTLLQKVLDWLHDFVDKVREALGSTPRLSEEAQLMRDLETRLRKTFGELWDKGIVKAAEVHDRVGSMETERKAKDSDRDTEYLELAKDPQKNQARLQEMVDQAAKRAGYTIRAQHGSFAEQRFTVFEPGERGEMWFGSPGTAYQRPQMYDTYLKMDNPYEVTYTVGADTKFDPQDVVEKGRQNGHDGGIVHFRLDSEMVKKNLPIIEKLFPDMQATDGFVKSFRFMPQGDLLNTLAKPGETLVEFMKRGMEGDLYQWYTVYKPSQIKSADPVTYDDAGNVIPLSERFNEGNRDIRYSDRDYFDGMTEEQVQEELTRLQQKKATAREKQRSLEKTDEYKRLFQDVLDKKSPEAISAFNKWADESGYVAAVDRAKEVDARRSEGAKVLDRLIDQRMEREEREAIQKSGKSEAEYFGAQAVKDFGYTPYFYDAGYIVPNGKMLNFSGQKGRHFGSRGQDHRAIGMIYATTKGSAAMNRFMNQGNVRIMAESPGIDISNVTPLTKEQYATIRRFVNEARSEEYFNLDFSDERGNNLGSIEYEGRFTADRVLNDIRHFFETGEVRQLSGLSAFYSERDYDLPSDLELLDRAADSLTESGSEEYWEELLKSAPELADSKEELRGLMKDYRAQAKKLTEAQEKLDKARRELTTTNRKLNTQGIGKVTLDLMKELGAGDANGRKVSKQVAEALTTAYQEALDMLDRDEKYAAAWNHVYQNGVVKAADILGSQATHSEKYGGKWATTSLAQYYGEGGQQAILATVANRVTQDFVMNRYRPGVQATAADRLVERTEKRMQAKVDTARAQAQEAKVQAAKLEEENTWLTEQAQRASQTANTVNELYQDALAELKESKSKSKADRRKAQRRADTLRTQLTASRQEAKTWKAQAEAEARARTLEGLNQRAATYHQAVRAANAETALARERVNAKGWENIADQTAKQLDKTMDQKARLVRQLEAQVQRERDILEGKLKPLAMQRLLKAEREKAEAKVAQHKDEVFQNYKNRRRDTAMRGRIRNLANELRRSMTNPTDRNYLPAHLAEHMTALLDSLDRIDEPRPGTQAADKHKATAEALRRLAETYNDISGEDVDPMFRTEYDDELWQSIKDLAKVFEAKEAELGTSAGGINADRPGLRDLSSEELEQVYDLVKTIRDQMRQATKLLNSAQWATVQAAIQSVVQQQQNMTPYKDAKKLERAKRLRMLDGMSVMRAVEMMSNWDRNSALYQTFQAVEQGQVDADRWVMEYNKAMQDLRTGKNEKAYRQALTKAEDFGATDRETGKTVKMTKLQAIQLLMTWQREQANSKLEHLQKGGAVIRDALAIQDGKGRKAVSHRVAVTPLVISNIQNSLTAWDRAYMKAVRDYLNREARETNKVLYQLKHRVLTTEAAYMPYVVDKGYLDAKLESSDVFNLFVKTPGSTQALQKKAPQPVIIDGLDTMMQKHVQETANYVGLAIPIRDFAKVFNGRMASTDGTVYTSLQKTIQDNFTEKGTDLILQALLDVQGSTKGNSWNSQIAETLNKMQSMWVRTALMVNPSVTIKQAASYIAAESVLSHRALTAGNRPIFSGQDASHSPSLIAQIFATPEGRTAQRLYNEIDQHTSMHYMRRLGMSQAELADQALRSSPLRRRMNAIGASMEQSKVGHAARKAGEALNPFSWIQRMDVATTAALWVACKEQAKLDGMTVNSQEYWQRTTELYERCLRETQPMYDGLHRTANQKQHGGIMTYLFPFRTVPIQNHGQVAASYEALLASKNKSKAEQAKAGKFFVKTVWAQTESAFIFSLMTFIAAAMKRKTKKYRDEDEELTPWSLAKGFGADVASTWFSVLFPVFGSEMWNVGNRIYDKIEGSSGYTYDAFSIGILDMLNDLASAGDKLWVDIGKLHRGEPVNIKDIESHGLTLLLKGAKLAGLPADTVKTYAEGTIGNVKDLLAGRVPALNDESWERSAATNARRLIKAAVAGNMGKVDEVLAEMRKNILTDKPGLKEDKVNSKIQAAVGAYLKEQYMAGNLSEQKVTDYLVQYGNSGDNNDAYWKIREWEAKAAHPGDDDYSFSPYEQLRDLITGNGDISSEMARLTEHGVKFQSINTDIKKTIKQLYTAGKITEDEAMAMLRKYHKVKDDKTKQYRPDTEDEAWFALDEWADGIDADDDEEYSYQKYRGLYSAIESGTSLDAAWKELSDHGISESTLKTQVKDYIKEQFDAGLYSEKTAMDKLKKYSDMDDNEAYWEVDKWKAKAEGEAAGQEVKETNYRDLYAAIDAGDSADSAVKELTAHGYKEKDIYAQAKDYLVGKYEEKKINETQFRNMLSRYAKVVKTEDVDEIVTKAKCYRETGHRIGNFKEDYLDGEITGQQVKQWSMKYSGRTSQEADNLVRFFELAKANPNLEFDEASATRYYDGTKDKTQANGHESAYRAGMSLEAYLEAREILSKVEGIDANGDGRSDTGTKEQATINAIAKMNLTARQKDALYYELYKGGTVKGVYKTW